MEAQGLIYDRVYVSEVFEGLLGNAVFHSLFGHFCADLSIDAWMSSKLEHDQADRDPTSIASRKEYVQHLIAQVQSVGTASLSDKLIDQRSGMSAFCLSVQSSLDVPIDELLRSIERLVPILCPTPVPSKKPWCLRASYLEKGRVTCSDEGIRIELG